MQLKLKNHEISQYCFAVAVADQLNYFQDLKSDIKKKYGIVSVIQIKI